MVSLQYGWMLETYQGYQNLRASGGHIWSKETGSKYCQSGLQQQVYTSESGLPMSMSISCGVLHKCIESTGG